MNIFRLGGVLKKEMGGYVLYTEREIIFSEGIDFLKT
jgi:hypothetical protein